MKYDVVFESERIYFVKVCDKLVHDYLTMVNDEEVQKYISKNRNKYEVEQEKEWVRKKLLNNNFIFSMIEKETNEFIGNIEIMDITNNSGELGIAITSKKQNNHFGQEAIKAMIEYAFDKFNINEIELNVYKFNPRGIHCYEKIGFIKDSETEEEVHMIYKRNV